MKNLFLSENGDLYTNENWHVVRESYQKTFSRIDTNLKLRATIRAGSVAWHGCYPMFLYFADGDACCFKCARAEYKIFRNEITGAAVNWEDTEMYCSHCNNKIDSAYGETE